MKKHGHYILILSILLATSSSQLFAQGPPPPPPPGLPIDGGVLFLLASAVGYAIKKLK